MDIGRLKEIVKDSIDSNKQFFLSASALNSAEADQVSNDYLVNDSIRLANATIEEPAAGDSIIVRGVGLDLPFKDLGVGLLFYIVGGDAAFSLTAEGDPGWTLAKSFPLFRGSLADQLSFATTPPPRLRLCSHERGDSVRKGLYFDGVIDLNAMTGGLATLVRRQYQSISGPVVLKEKGSKFYQAELAAPVSENVNLSIATVKELSFKVSNRLDYNPLRNNYYATPYVEFGAKIPFTAQGEDHEIPVRAQIISLDRGFRFAADLTDVIDAAIDELKSLTNREGVESVLPENFHLANLLKFNELFFDFDPGSANKVSMIYMGVQSASPWQVLHLQASNQDLTAQNVQLTFVVFDPFSDGEKPKSLTISGELAIGDAGVLVLSMRYPAWVVRAYLKEDTTLNLTEVIRLFIGSAATLPEMEVGLFDLEVGADGYRLNVGVDGELQLPELPVSVEEVGLSIEHTNQLGTKAALRGLFFIAGVNVSLSAEYPGAGEGWFFEGATGPDQEIPIGSLIEDLAERFGQVTLPSALADLVVENLKVTYDTRPALDQQKKEFTVSCESKLRVEETDVDITVTIDIKDVNGNYSKEFGGTLKIGEFVFDLHFVQDSTSNLFVATYKPATAGNNLSVKNLVQGISPAIASYLPDGLSVELKNVQFVFSKDSLGSAFLFGLDIAAGINLSNLPLVGREFPRDQTVGVDDLQLLVASRGFTLTEANAINSLIPDGVTRLPVQPQSATSAATEQTVIQQGLSVTAQMKFGGSPQVLELPVTTGTQAAGTGQPASTTAGAATTTASVAATDNAKWFTLQKSFGPVTFNRVGVQYQDGAVWFLLDAALSVAGLTLALDGLAAGSPLNQFHPQFRLRGLGIDYSNGPVEIGGAFLWRQIEIGGKKYDEYDGAALIKTPQFALSAIGSYADLDGHPSLFVYAVLDYPLGGPAFFFVTGLAAGFGYNRSLRMPAIEQVAQFPLVAQAMSGPRAPNNLEAELQSIQQYIPPAVGEIFFAVGVKFTSFKIVDSFVLLTVAFGARFEVNLLGLSTLIAPPQAPPNTPPLAVVQMAIRASFIPDEGFLGAQAQLTPASYIFTRDCHLTGGFAFYSWFSGDHAGEFVITLGGYHPSFNVPDYYPKVPRLGLSWQVNGNLGIKGGAYYALTPSALMAGGSLQATWKDGNLNAWFNAGADFIVSWKPYHYDAYIYVNMGVSYTFTVDLWVTTVRKTISVDVGADLHIWGPEFSGIAHIKLKVISFDVTFGNAASQRPQPISWDEFRTSFLPGPAEVCGVAIKSGLARTTEAKQWVVNPKDFCLVTDSMIPSKSALAGNNQLQFPEPQFGVGPMGVNHQNLSAKHKIEISRIVDNVSWPAEADFDFVPIKKKVPAGLWGNSLTPSINGQGFIDGALSGFEIRPKMRPAPGVTADIDRANLQYDPTDVQNAFYWENFKPFNASTESDDARRERIRASLAQTETVEARDRLLRDLGLSVNLTINESTADAFSVPPQVGVLAW
jgi:hypothetical protein